MRQELIYINRCAEKIYNGTRSKFTLSIDELEVAKEEALDMLEAIDTALKEAKEAKEAYKREGG